MLASFYGTRVFLFYKCGCQSYIFRYRSNWYKSNMESFFLCNGNETQEIVKPTGAHDFCFQRFIGMVCTRKPGIFDLCRAPTIRSKYYKVSCRPLSNLSNNSFWYSLSKVPCRSFGYASSCSCCQLSFSLLTTIG